MRVSQVGRQSVETKFRVLRLVGTLWKILAWVVLAVGILTSLGMLITTIVGGAGLRELFEDMTEGVGIEIPTWLDWLGGVALFFVSLVGTLLNFVVLYAGGELVHLLLAIEENTRLAYEQLQWLQAGTAPTFAGQPPPAQ
jgi:hypothetical protein